MSVCWAILYHLLGEGASFSCGSDLNVLPQLFFTTLGTYMIRQFSHYPGPRKRGHQPEVICFGAPTTL